MSFIETDRNASDVEERPRHKSKNRRTEGGEDEKKV